VLFVYGVDAGPLYRTESLRAIIGRECLHGNWLFPVLYGEPFLTKPPGHYAAIGLVSLTVGEVTPVTARIPSILAATAAVFLVYALFRRAVDERAALLAAFLVPTSVLWLDKAPSAEIDMTLVGWVTAALVLFHRAAERDSAPWWVLALLCVAGGTLTKWTAPAFFYLTVIPFLAWRGELARLLAWKHLLACGVAVGVCALWALAVAESVGWEALRGTIESEARYRLSPKSTERDSLAVASYPMIVLAAHLPVAAFGLLTFRPSFWARWDDRGRRLLQLLHCWAWPNLLFWSLVPNHNVRYALPMSAGLMGLGAMGLMGLMRQMGPIWSRRHMVAGIVGFLCCWLVVKVVFVELVIPNRAAKRDPITPAMVLRERVPAGEPLHLFRLKDEGVLFYYGRPAVRLSHPRELPPGAFAVLIRQEWDDRADFGHLQLVDWLRDQQGDPLILVRVP
jgi:4-amino-4-deoxy-L-arabinose transferase-like glycosyltransferase